MLVHALHAEEGVLLPAVEDYVLLLVLGALDLKGLGEGGVVTLAALAGALVLVGGVDAAALAGLGLEWELRGAAVGEDHGDAVVV